MADAENPTPHVDRLCEILGRVEPHAYVAGSVHGPTLIIDGHFDEAPLEAALAAWLATVKADVWDEGYEQGVRDQGVDERPGGSGHTPNTFNPYRLESEHD